MHPVLPSISSGNAAISLPRAPLPSPQTFGSLTKWNEEKTDCDVPHTDTERSINAVYPIDPGINHRIIFTDKHMLSLKGLDAVVCVNNEKLDCRTGLTGEIANAEGAQHFAFTCNFHAPCTTRSAVAVPVNNLRFALLIQAVPPKYRDLLRKSSIDALSQTYDSVFHRAHEHHVGRLGLINIAVSSKEFDPELAAHVALSSMRRALGPSGFGGNHMTVVFVAQDQDELALFRRLAPAYFPRCTCEVALQDVMLIEETRHLTVAQLLSQQSRFSQSTGKHQWTPPPLVRGLRWETAEAFVKTAQEDLDFATAKEYRPRDEQCEYLVIERPDNQSINQSNDSNNLKIIIQSRKFDKDIDPQTAVKSMMEILNRAGNQLFDLYFDARNSVSSTTKNLQLIVLLLYRLNDSADCLEHLNTLSVVGAPWGLKIMMQTVSQFFRAKLRICHIDTIPGEHQRVHIASVTNIHRDIEEDISDY